jgi:hypothetical protein
MFTVLDASEQYILQQVREEIKREVTRKLSEEFNDLIQSETNKAISEIMIRIYKHEDALMRAEEVHILLEWVKSREEKRRHVSETILKEVS